MLTGPPPKFNGTRDTVRAAVGSAFVKRINRNLAPRVEAQRVTASSSAYIPAP